MTMSSAILYRLLLINIQNVNCGLRLCLKTFNFGLIVIKDFNFEIERFNIKKILTKFIIFKHYIYYIYI
jgi:hypothetical protein